MVLITPLPIEDAEQSWTIHPHFSLPLLSLVVAHLGNTSALLCSAIDGKVLPLTKYHHPYSRVESDRLHRIGTGLITDSFGKSRWGHQLVGRNPSRRCGLSWHQVSLGIPGYLPGLGRKTAIHNQIRTRWRVSAGTIPASG
ncbi:hypothetical protein PGTUg99_000705 [Puccinia graminis f. sp. tritici]|uniref:PPM-type phosphatase domain-containing protein n=1 Tax=Puccinia graminis f. sp. tritici TaxID=56615 RepID=A0A5B0N711_PUCGR|nr:hypothetical protein PGTUg99_000705 [Puccinia graminis f. sp. tritici]